MQSNTFELFDKKVDELTKIRKPKIAFGLKEPNEVILKSLKKSKKFADIVLVGPKTIENVKGFEVITGDAPEEKLASMLANNEVEGIVRGTIDDFKTYEAYQRLSGEKSDFNPGLMEDPLGHRLFIGPCSNPEGWTKEERLKEALGFAKFCKEWEIVPKIAVFTGVRHVQAVCQDDLAVGFHAVGGTAER